MTKTITSPEFEALLDELNIAAQEYVTLTGIAERIYQLGYKKGREAGLQFGMDIADRARELGHRAGFDLAEDRFKFNR